MGVFRRGKRGSGSGSKGKSGAEKNKSKGKPSGKVDPKQGEASSDAKDDGPGTIASAIVATGSGSGGTLAKDGKRGLPPRRDPDATPNIPTEVLIVDELDNAEELNPTRETARPMRDVTPLFSNQPATPDLEVDPMATIGRQTTITGNIVSEEDLEIHGTIEGSVRLGNHQLTVGPEGQVKASVDAQCVLVYGRITGDVVASDVVEVHKGGIVGGDIRAPRIIMHDGAIVVGGLDMSAALPNSGANEPAKKTEKKNEKKAGKKDGPRLATVSPILETDVEPPAIEVEAD